MPDPTTLAPSTRIRLDLPLTSRLTQVGSGATTYIASNQIASTSLSALEQSIAAATGTLFGGTGPPGPTGATGSLLGAAGTLGSIQYNAGGGVFGGNGTLTYDGVRVLSLNGQTIASTGTGNSAQLNLNNGALVITPTSVNTLNNTLDDGAGNMTFAATATAVNGTFTSGVNTSTLTVSGGTTTQTLQVNGLVLQKNLQTTGLATVSTVGAATFATALFSVGTWTISGGNLIFPNVSTANNYWVSIQGNGTLAAGASGTGVVAVTNATSSTLFNGTAINGTSSSQPVFLEAQVYVSVPANTANATLAFTTAGATAFQGAYNVQQLF